ncbi:hypothetical protein EDD37DRAFT_75124 [Exophiala viscosa]|uniref:uncharacterized protein n=1 Tax=Exophiala viscosa TaxID=2486360 RepID=UPI0021A045B3|nr:hypothetical protein EDD37DRAFT_75124 [Exophiala viscosa]
MVHSMLVHHSSARRKACTECVRVKRRCDLVVPACTRCNTRGLDCQYISFSKRLAEDQIGAVTPVARPMKEQCTLLSDPGSIVSSSPRSPWQGTTFSTVDFPELAPITKDQVDFCTTQFQSCIAQLVQGVNLPFIHHTSYKDTVPCLYQDLVGVSAMYCQRTPENLPVVFAILDDNISRLIAKSSSWGPEELLLGTQALIVYQIIRLFDGDIRQRANAERQSVLLETWTSQLQAALNTFQNTFQLESPTHRWWVLLESARRTLLVSVMLQALYSLLRDGICTSVPYMATLPVSLDGALWGMSTEDWHKTALGAEGDPVTYREFVAKWVDGAPLQIEAYETILLVACKHNAQRMSFKASS